MKEHKLDKQPGAFRGPSGWTAPVLQGAVPDPRPRHGPRPRLGFVHWQDGDGSPIPVCCHSVAVNLKSGFQSESGMAPVPIRVPDLLFKIGDAPMLPRPSPRPHLATASAESGTLPPPGPSPFPVC
jgi:hypothetical protein